MGLLGNLHGIVRGAVTTVNPDVIYAWKSSTGSIVGAGRKPVPQYAADVLVRGNPQALTYKDLMQLDGVNMNGVKRAIYLYGQVDGVVRVNAKGGDLLVEQVTGDTWLVVQPLEQWNDKWCKVAVTLQNGA